MGIAPYKLWPHPAVVAFKVGMPRQVEQLERLIVASRQGSHLLCHCPGVDCCPTFVQLEKLQARYPDRHLHLMANSHEELRQYRERFTLPSAYAPTSLYIDGRTFYPEKLAVKSVDAVYVARFDPESRDCVKRHLLARKVESLEVVTFAMNAHHALLRVPIQQTYYATYPELAHAQVNSRFLSRADVRKAFGRARTNLGLSAAEGCMRGFIEGLLCGVPGVSTRCQCARRAFFHPEYVAVVDDDPEAVAEGVRRQAARGFQPDAIRQFALNLIESQRRGYSEYIASLVQRSPAEVHRHIFAAGARRLTFRVPR